MKGEIKYVKPIGNCNIRNNRYYNINSGVFCNSNGNTRINNDCRSNFFNNFGGDIDRFRD